MNTENKIAVIDPKEYGLQETQVTEIQSAFLPKIVERDGLSVIYSEIIKQEINPDLCKKAGELRRKLVKVRTGISDIHKTQKAFYLAAGRYVDAWKNKETLPVTQMEENLSAIEEYYIRIETQKKAKLQAERALELQKYLDEGAYIPNNLGEQPKDVWENYLLGVKTAYETRKENERVAAEKEAKRIEEEKIEQERIRKENEQLKKEADEERIKRARIQKELDDKKEAERKAKEAEESKLQLELSKGDSDKMKDLANELVAIKVKYNFSSDKNKKVFSDIIVVIDKIINHINQNI